MWQPKTISVIFHKNDGSGATVSQTFTYGVSGQYFNSGISRPGYSCLGWSLSSSSTTADYSYNNGVADEWIYGNSPSINLYAVWKANVIHFKYYSNNGSQTNFVNWDAKPTSSWPNNHWNYTSGTYKQSYSGYTGTGYYGTTTTGGILVGEDESFASYEAICDKYGVSYYTSETTINIYAQWGYSNAWVNGKSDCFEVAASYNNKSNWILSTKICWSESYNAYKNTSKVSITGLSLKAAANYGYVFYLGGSELAANTDRGIYINGTRLVPMSNTTGGYSVYLGSPSNTYYAMTPSGNGMAFPWTSGEIAHASNGTLSVPIRVFFEAVRQTSGGSYYSEFDSTVNITLTDTRP